MKAPARVLLISTIVSVLVMGVALFRYGLLTKSGSTGAVSEPLLPEVTGEAANAEVGKAPTAKQLANGKDLYTTKTCGVCHGADGKADSPTAKAMKATNLVSGVFHNNKSKMEPVAYIAKVIAEGVPGTGMASFKAQIPKESDRMDLAEYVHSLAKK
ncbi:c-type cytochrome [Fluviispira multicolorata]|uniref:C-type cytochrome n=1 Tax=Fluviispira multicolorata TaxID=2654512 RepID=A0A833JDF3_9BACT|nr:cytochrome c [Fluviispira multicolorata]KAB8031878.1 c-type cytochrome [Fluviispira multicolorata]